MSKQEHCHGVPEHTRVVSGGSQRHKRNIRGLRNKSNIRGFLKTEKYCQGVSKLTIVLSGGS